MNFDDLQKTWSQQTVAGAPADAARLRDALAHEARQRSRSLRRIVGMVTFVLVTGWGVGLTAHFTGIKPFTPVTLLTFATASAFNLTFLAGAVRAWRRMRQEELGLGGSLAEALRTSVRGLERQMRDCRLFAWALAVEFAIEVGGTLLFYVTGNLPRHGVLPKIALITLLVAGIAATLHRYYHRRLAPRHAALRREIAELGG